MDSTKMTIQHQRQRFQFFPRDEIEEHVIFCLLRGGWLNGTAVASSNWNGWGSMGSCAEFCRVIRKACFATTYHISLVSLKHESNNLMLLAG